MSRPDNLNIIRKRIQESRAGSVFVASDFADITENVKVGVSLSRLEEEGMIKRIMRGVYYKPEYSKLLSENVAPSPNACICDRSQLWMEYCAVWRYST